MLHDKLKPLIVTCTFVALVSMSLSSALAQDDAGRWELTLAGTGSSWSVVVTAAMSEGQGVGPVGVLEFGQGGVGRAGLVAEPAAGMPAGPDGGQRDRARPEHEGLPEGGRCRRDAEGGDRHHPVEREAIGAHHPAAQPVRGHQLHHGVPDDDAEVVAQRRVLEHGGDAVPHEAREATLSRFMDLFINGPVGRLEAKSRRPRRVVFFMLSRARGGDGSGDGKEGGGGGAFGGLALGLLLLALRLRRAAVVPACCSCR